MRRRTLLAGAVPLLSGCSGLWNGDFPHRSERPDAATHPQLIASFSYDRDDETVTARVERVAGFDESTVSLFTVLVETSRVAIEPGDERFPPRPGDTFRVEARPGDSVKMVAQSAGGGESHLLEAYHVPASDAGVIER